VNASAKATDESLREAVEATRDAFETAMDDDLNLREATAALLSLTDAVNRHLDARSVETSRGDDSYDYRGLHEAVIVFDQLGGDVLGLQFESPTDGDVDLAGELVELILDVREAEREAGNYDRADELRDALDTVGVTVEDGPDGVEYRFE